MQADFVIVGGGSAGCVMAARLSEALDTTVILLEAGGRGRNPLMRIPAGLPELLGNRIADWDYATVPQLGLAGRCLRWPRGRALGGSSAINAMCYARGDLKDYDDWGHGWSGAEALHFFKKAECFSGGLSQWRGDDGPLRVTRPDWTHPATMRYLSAGQQAGHRLVEDFSAPDHLGIGRFDATTHRGVRWSTAQAYLSPEVRARANLTIRTGAQVAKVGFDGSRATSVHLLDGTVFAAAREVILCAGAIGTPQLLMLSGVGPADHLRDLGIPVVQHAPNVGRNLQDHLDITLMVDTLPGTAIGYAPSLLGPALRAAWDWLWRRSGLLASNLAEGTGFARSRTGLDRPDIQFHFLPALGENHGETRNWGKVGMSLHACCLYPQSKGQLRLASAQVTDKPIIDPNYLADPRDLEVLVAGAKLSAAILEQPAFDPIRSGWHQPKHLPQNDADWATDIRARAESIYHPVGTAALGMVTDGEGAVRGVQGLRVVDASLMPRTVGGNTNAPVVMMAERIAARMASGASG
ncbi:MAG: GMC family oxidoreductase N-terminal domain-containing protein [Pseudomonadota bacterium]